MNPELWDAISEQFNGWLVADEAERQRLIARLSVESPELATELLALTRSPAAGFLETPALILAAQQAAEAEEALIASGMTIGPYRISSLLARGGMGDVYRATDERLHREVALKVLARTENGGSRRVDRFMHEARVTASLDHPNVVRVFDVGRFEDRAYLVAELLEGETLRSRIMRGPIAAGEVLRLAREIAEGLAAAHAAGLVHRDLKPDNIFLTRSGTTKILDFGIAKLVQDETVRGAFSTATGIVLGTAGYIAPEQIRGNVVDSRADLFALGAVLFEMLTGERAFVRDHLIESLHAILHDPPSMALAQRPDVPVRLKEIVARLLEKDPSARSQSARETIEALEGVDPADVGARRKRLFSPTRVAVGALVLAVVAGTAAMVARDATPSPATPPATTAVIRKPLKLAIMPFRSIPPTEHADPLELGLAEVLISRLGQIPDLDVLPLTATARLRSEDPVDAARSLSADRILTVTIQRDGHRVRAVPRLVSVAGELLWTTTVDTDASSVFSIQDIIVGRMVDELAPKLSPGARTKLSHVGTTNNVAFEAYVRGLGHVFQVTGADLKKAIGAFEEAVRSDPAYADAWASLGSAYRRMPITGGMPTAEAMPAARRAAERALQIDPAHGEAHSVLGTVAFWYEWDYPKSERLLRRAIELQPSSLEAAFFLAHLYASTGRHHESLVEIRRARALDPSWMSARANEGQFLFMARRYEEAIRHLDDAIALNQQFWPSRAFRMYALIALGRHEEAIRESDALMVLQQTTGSHIATWLTGLRGYALVRAGRSGEVAALLADLKRVPHDGAMAEAIVLHALGRDAEAFEAIGRAIEARDQSVTFLGVHPWWDDVRHVPEFRELLHAVNLLEVSDALTQVVRRK